MIARIDPTPLRISTAAGTATVLAPSGSALVTVPNLANGKRANLVAITVRASGASATILDGVLIRPGTSPATAGLFLGVSNLPLLLDVTGQASIGFTNPNATAAHDVEVTMTTLENWSGR